MTVLLSSPSFFAFSLVVASAEEVVPVGLEVELVVAIPPVPYGVISLLILVEVEKVVIVPVEVVVGIVKADKGFSEDDVSIASALVVRDEVVVEIVVLVVVVVVV